MFVSANFDGLARLRYYCPESFENISTSPLFRFDSVSPSALIHSLNRLKTGNMRPRRDAGKQRQRTRCTHRLLALQL